MTLVRWSPMRDVAAFPSDVLGMQREINRMFSEFFRGAQEDDGFMPPAWKPAVDIVERDEEFIAKVELPGVRKEDVNITVQENTLTIRGEKQQEKKQEKREDKYHRLERFTGSFQRSFTLPGSIKNDGIEAEYADGILTVRLPKAEHAKMKQIEIKVK